MIKRIIQISLCTLIMMSCQEASTNNIIDIDKNKPLKLPTSEEIKSIPTPPIGWRWVVNEIYTDEFNGTELDESKWYNYHPSWRGRPPGLFEAKNVSVSDGYMALRGEPMEEKSFGDDTFNISCAAVVSKTQDAKFGYYECRFKANKTTLSSTFWMSTRGGQIFDTQGRQDEGCIPGLFSQELDICECIGRGGDFDGNYFANGMHANAHYWLNPDEGDNTLDVTIEMAAPKIENGEIPSDSFNTYGAWWVDSNTVIYYLNNDQATHRNFTGRVVGDTDNNYGEISFKFTEGMGVNMVVETYPYPWIEIPNNEELSDPSLNTTYYDWVRAYMLVEESEVVEDAKEMTMFSEQINIDAAESQNSISLQYTASIDREIEIVIYDYKSNVFDSKSITARAGYGNIEISYSDFKSMEQGQTYYVAAYIGQSSATSQSEYLAGDSYQFTKK